MATEALRHREDGREPGRGQRLRGADLVDVVRRHHHDGRAGVHDLKLALENAHRLIDGNTALQHREISRRSDDLAALDAAEHAMGEVVGDDLDALGEPLGAQDTDRGFRRHRAAHDVVDVGALIERLFDEVELYLIPVIMLFQVGDVPAIFAIVIYAVIPAMRYTILGLRGVPHETVEAATMSGCSYWQLLWKMRMPLALPEIMLGINQTIMFALFMVIIAAFIGTRDLGQEIFRALTFADAGKGLVVGLCVAFMGLAADRLIGQWAANRKRQLGLA
jgi:hypothetical protein